MKNDSQLIKLSTALLELSKKVSDAFFCASEIDRFHKQRLRNISVATLPIDATDAERRAWSHCEAIRQLFDTDESIFEKGIELVVDGVEDRTFTGDWHKEEYLVSITVNSKDIRIYCSGGYVSVDDQNRRRYFDFDRITINGTDIEDELSGELTAISFINTFFTSQLLAQAFDFNRDMDSTVSELDDEQIKALVALLSIK